MRHLFERYLVPDIAPQVERTSFQLHVRTFGLRESEVAERLADIDLGGARHRAGIVIGYRAHFPEIEVKVLARAADEATARALATEVAREIEQRLAPHAYGGRDDSFPAYVGQLLRVRGLKLAVAESCTGGLIGKLLTDPPGSSDYLLLDVVSYANNAKRDVLGVDPALLDRHGAVSAEVATAMAEGVLAKAGADLALATTGIAGPGGGSEQKPVGWCGSRSHGAAKKPWRNAYKHPGIAIACARSRLRGAATHRARRAHMAGRKRDHGRLILTLGTRRTYSQKANEGSRDRKPITAATNRRQRNSSSKGTGDSDGG